jgi:cytidylate kinase
MRNDVDERAEGESPLHGFQGDRAPAPPRSGVPAALTVAVSREAGARGGTIARRAGRKLGWQVYDQELLEYMSQDPSVIQSMVDALGPAAATWVEGHLERLLRSETVRQHTSVVNLARVVLALGASGAVVLIGRGAGCILPRASTLNVRVIAALEDRIAYMAQWLRLTADEAAERVRLRDERRAEFVLAHFHRQPSDVYQYDLLLNSGILGEDVCADLIARATLARNERLQETSG